MRRFLHLTACLFVLFFVSAIPVRSLPANDACRIQILDSENGWPVPLVELRTTHGMRFISDNAGVVCLDVPELMNKPTWLSVIGHGYSIAKDGFGYEGVRVIPSRGGSLEIRVRRELPARRLGRITGGGLFAESQKLREHLDWNDQGILGCDSVQNTQHRGRMYWAWGDTILSNYPLGRFHMIAGTTALQPLEKFQPPIKLAYQYFTDKEGIPDNVAKMPGDGPTWLNGLVSLPDQSGKQQLCATYAKIRPPLTEYELGLCVWNEDSDRFEPFKVLWSQSEGLAKPQRTPGGHAVRWAEDADHEWILFGDPFPSLRCKPTFEDWCSPENWQPLDPQPTVLSSDGTRTVKVHRGAIAWNDYLNCWVSVFTEFGGESSQLGELWFATASQPTGPWQDAIKVVTHDKYSFYNPQLHPEFTAEGESQLLFEATFTHTFSKTTTPVPRHDYNQVLYSLDLSEIRTAQKLSPGTR
ncbi:MAG: hypothetical protein KDA91_25250 [Planctomycetaceae bacterium]|nr:hypothetical protein [Planctomycetaceae bacterium]